MPIRVPGGGGGDWSSTARRPSRCACLGNSTESAGSSVNVVDVSFEKINVVDVSFEKIAFS